MKSAFLFVPIFAACGAPGATNDAALSDLVGVDVAVTTPEDVAARVTLPFKGGATGEPVGFAFFSTPRIGTVVVDDGTATFTPLPQVSGADALQFAPMQGGAVGLPATLSITVTPVDDGPRVTVAGPVVDDLGVTFFASAVDDDSAAPVIFAASFAHGAVTVSSDSDDNAAILYVAADDFHGTDSGSVTATDDGGASTSTDVSVDVP